MIAFGESIWFKLSYLIFYVILLSVLFLFYTNQVQNVLKQSLERALSYKASLLKKVNKLEHI